MDEDGIPTFCCGTEKRSRGLVPHRFVILHATNDFTTEKPQVIEVPTKRPTIEPFAFQVAHELAHHDNHIVPERFV